MSWQPDRVFVGKGTEGKTRIGLGSGIVNLFKREALIRGREATVESREGPSFTQENEPSPSLPVSSGLGVLSFSFLSPFSSGWCWFLAGVGWRVNGVEGCSFMFWCPCALFSFFFEIEFGEGGLKRVVVIWQPCYHFKRYSDSSQTPRSVCSEDEQKWSMDAVGR